MKKKRELAFWILNISIPLVVGLVIYIVLKPDAFISVGFFRLFNVSPITVYPTGSNLGKTFVYLVRCYLCDILWAYALSITCCMIIGTKHKLLLLAAAISCSFEFVIEILQKTSWFPGTFDFWDITVEFIATLLAVLMITIHNRNINRGGHKNEETQH